MLTKKTTSLLFLVLPLVLVGFILTSSRSVLFVVDAVEEEYNFVKKFGSQGPKDSQFINPYDVVIDSNSVNIYIVDTGNSRIQKFSNDGTFVKSWGNQGSSNSQFSFPSSIDVDHTGNVYVVDSGSHRIKKFNGEGKFITKWGSQGTGDGQFVSPSAVAADASGNVYIVDTGNNRIQKLPVMVNSLQNGTMVSSINQVVLL